MLQLLKLNFECHLCITAWQAGEKGTFMIVVVLYLVCYLWEGRGGPSSVHL